MKKPVLLLVLVTALVSARAHALTDEEVDARERADQAARFRRVTHRVGTSIEHGAQHVEHGVRHVAHGVEEAWKKLEKTTVHVAHNVGDAIRTIAGAAAEGASDLGQHTANFFRRTQKHLDVVRKGDSIAIASCNSQLLNGPARLGVGSGESCKLLHNGTMKISDVKKCAQGASERDGLAAKILAKDLKKLENNGQYEHRYFMMYDASAEDFQHLLTGCQARSTASRPRPAPAVTPAPAPEPAPAPVPVPEPAPATPPATEVNGTI